MPINTFKFILVLIVLKILNFAIADENDVFNQQRNVEVFTKKVPVIQTQQNAKKIGLKFNNINIREIFTILGDYADIKFVLDESVNGNLSININDANLSETLNSLKKAGGLNISEENGIFVVTKESKAGCNHNGKYYPINTLKEIQGKLFICSKISKAEGDIFNKKTSVIWQLR